MSATTSPVMIAAFDVLLSDLDGVVYEGKNAVPFAVESLNRAETLGVKVGYLTNNASRTPETVAAQLNGFGLHVASRDIVTSPHAAVPLLKGHVAPGAEVLVVGGEGLLLEVERAGYSVVRESTPATAAVIQGFNPDVAWNDLAEATYAIQGGAYWVGTNADWTIPREKGIAPGNGTLLAAVHTATGVFPVIAGKPEAPIYATAADRFGWTRALAIGDRLDTDILGANRAGLHSLMVLTGVDRAKQILAAVPDQRPTYIVNDLRAMFEPYDAPAVDGARATCLGSAVTLVGDDVVIESGDPRAIETLRCAAAVIWTSGRQISTLAVPESLYTE